MCKRKTKIGLAGLAAGLLISAMVSEPAMAISVGVRTATGETCRVLFERPHLHASRSGYVADMATAQVEAI
ncbi:MAG: hypothetical protein ACR2OX_10715, partial [Methyloligellaceae bacterium]